MEAGHLVELQILISVITVLGAGLAAYVGIRVALAKNESHLSNHDEILEAQDKRLERLERPYFDRK